MKVTCKRFVDITPLSLYSLIVRECSSITGLVTKTALGRHGITFEYILPSFVRKKSLSPKRCTAFQSSCKLLLNNYCLPDSMLEQDEKIHQLFHGWQNATEIKISSSSAKIIAKLESKICLIKRWFLATKHFRNFLCWKVAVLV